MGPAIAAELVPPYRRHGRRVIPCHSFGVEKIDIPSRSVVFSNQPIGEGVSGENLVAGIVEVFDAGVLNPPRRSLGHLKSIVIQKIDPYETYADRKIGEVFQYPFLHRTGAPNAGRSCRRENGDESKLVLVLVEIRFQRFDAVSQ